MKGTNTRTECTYATRDALPRPAERLTLVTRVDRVTRAVVQDRARAPTAQLASDDPAEVTPTTVEGKLSLESAGLSCTTLDAPRTFAFPGGFWVLRLPSRQHLGPSEDGDQPSNWQSLWSGTPLYSPCAAPGKRNGQNTRESAFAAVGVFLSSLVQDRPSDELAVAKIPAKPDFAVLYPMFLVFVFLPLYLGILCCCLFCGRCLYEGSHSDKLHHGRLAEGELLILIQDSMGRIRCQL